MGTTFDDLLKKLHPTSEQEAQLVDTEDIIEINDKRQFIVPNTFNLTIAYEGDVNSQEVTFKLPRFHDSHDLASCNNKTLRWRNVSGEIEDWTVLQKVEETEDYVILKWIVPPAAFSHAGILDIAISIYDIIDNQLAFSWNTPTLSTLNVGKTLSNVGEAPDFVELFSPAKNEILVVREETQSIVAPQGYNFTFTTFGNKNTDRVFFQSTRKLGGMDLIDENTSIAVVVSMDKRVDTFWIDKNDIGVNFAEGSTGEGLVNFVWRVPIVVSHDQDGYVGPISVVITVVQDNKKWSTAPFGKLTIGKSIIDVREEVIPESYYNLLDGNVTTGLQPRSVGGIVKHRQAQVTEIETTNVEKNEIVVIYNTNGSVRTLAVGGNSSDLKDAKTIETMIQEMLANNVFVIDANN